MQYHEFNSNLMLDLLKLDYDYKNECVLKSKLKVKGVLIGDSITQYMEASVFFDTDGILMRGINGENSMGVLSRIETDVVQLKPEFCVILCGINDASALCGNAVWRTPDTPPQKILQSVIDNISKMVDILKENQIKPYVCSILPCDVSNWIYNDIRKQLVININEQLKQLDCDYIDYYSAFTDVHKLTSDGLHPNYEGYKIMSDILIQKGIVKAKS